MARTAVLQIALIAGMVIPAQAQDFKNFKNCAAAFRAGYWNMKSGEPGYAPQLDRDHDGVVCETDNRWVHARTSTAEALQKGGFYGAVNGTAFASKSGASKRGSNRAVAERNSTVTGGGF